MSRKWRPGRDHRWAVLLSMATVVVGTGVIHASAGASAPRYRTMASAGGPEESPVVAAAQSRSSAMHGPVRFDAALAAPSRRGDLLVAAVVCGVVGDGTPVPTLQLPTGWHEAVRRVGGFEGGLEAALYFYPSNPGGVRRFAVGSVPRGTDAYCTTFSMELRQGTREVRLVATGSGQSWGSSVTAAATDGPAPGSHTLAVLASTDGTEEVHTVYSVPTGFRVVQEQTDGRRFQPGTLSIRFGRSTGVQGGTVRWSGATTDGCAVVAVLHV